MNAEQAPYSTTNNEELYYSTPNCDGLYYSTPNREEAVYYSNVKELNAIEVTRNDACEMPPQHSFQINMEENPAYEVGRPRTVN